MNPNIFLRRMGISVVFRGRGANAAVLYLIIKMPSGKGCNFWLISGWFVRYFCWFVGGMTSLCGWFGWFAGGLGGLWVVLDGLWVVSSFTVNELIDAALILRLIFSFW